MLFLSGLLHAERVRRGTRTDTRALSTYKQAVLALRWLFDDTRMSQLARDNNIGVVDRLRLPRRGHHRARRAAAVAARGAAGRQGRRSHPRDRGRHPDPHRPHLHTRPDPRGGPVVVGQAPPPRRATSRSSPPRTAGRCGPRRCARAASTTPPPPAPTPTCSPRSPPGSTTASSAWPTWATKARPTLLRIPIKKTRRRRADRRPAGLQRRPRRPALPRRTRQLPAQDHLQSAAPLARLPLAHRRHRRRRARPAPPRTPPNDLTTNITVRDHHVARKGSVPPPLRGRWCGGESDRRGKGLHRPRRLGDRSRPPLEPPRPPRGPGSPAPAMAPASPTARSYWPVLATARITSTDAKSRRVGSAIEQAASTARS